MIVPRYCRHPFLDFALVWRVGDWSERAVQMVSFVATVSKTHSCNALVVQLVANGLHAHGIHLKRVVHHAVVPSVQCALVFEFTNQENMCKSVRALSSAAVTRPATNEILEWEEPADFRKLDEDCQVQVDEVSTADCVRFESLNRQKAFHWATVSVGANLVLRDSLCGTVFIGAETAM